MKKKWMVLCALLLVMCLLVMGGAGCSDGRIFGIQVWEPSPTLSPTPRPGTTFLEEDVVFSIPEPFRTVEEMKASGEEVTVEEVQNAFEMLAYKISCSHMEDEEGYQYVTSRFISITPKTYRAGATAETVKERNAPFYTAFEDGRYIVDVNLEFAAFGIPLKRSVRVRLPNEFGQVLEDLGLRDREIDSYFRHELIDTYYFAVEVGNIAYKPEEITLEFIAERLAGPENAEKRERTLKFFEKTFNNFDDLHRPFIPDTSQSYTE